MSVGSHFVLNVALQLQQSIELKFGALQWVSQMVSCGSVFMQQAQHWIVAVVSVWLLRCVEREICVCLELRLKRF